MVCEVMKMKVGLLVVVFVLILSACVVMQSPQVDSKESVQSFIGEDISITIGIPGHEDVKALSVELAYCPDMLVLTSGRWNYSEKPLIVDFNSDSKRGVLAYPNLKNLSDGQISIELSFRCLMVGEADLGVYVQYSDGTSSVTEYLDWGVVDIGCNHTDESGSTIIHVSAVPPTVENSGVVDHWICDLCGTHFKDQQGTEGDVDGWWVSYYIEYDLAGGRFTSEPVTSYSPGTGIEIVDPIKDDGQFQGWYLDETFTKPFNGDTEGLKGTINLHAKWEQLYSVSFNEAYLKVTLDGKEIVSGTFVMPGSVLSLEKRDVEGYHLGEIRATSPGTAIVVEKEYTVNNNTVFDVSCDRIIKITFNKNREDAIGSEGSMEWYNGLIIPLDEYCFMTDDFRVMGWSNTSKGVVEYTSDNLETLYSYLEDLDESVTDVQLYAVWGEKINVTFGIDHPLTYTGSEQSIYEHLTINGLESNDSIVESNISIVVTDLENNVAKFRDAGEYRITVSVESTDPTYRGTNSFNTSIMKAELTVGLNITSMTYGSQLNESDIVMRGFLGNDGRSSVSGSLEIKYDGPITIGSNKILLSGYYSENYDIIYDEVTIEILSKELSVSWPEVSFTYNGMPQYPEPVVKGLASDGTSYSVIVEDGDSRVVGNYTARLSIDGEYSNLYTISESKKTFQYSIVKGTHPDTTVEVIQRIGSTVEGIIDLAMLNIVDDEGYIIKSASVENNDIVEIDIGENEQYRYRFKGYSQTGSVEAKVVVSSDNYNDFNVILKFIIIDKEPVTITNVQINGLDKGSKVYDGMGLMMSPTADVVDSNDNPYNFPIKTTLNILCDGQYIDSKRMINDPLDAGKYELIVSVDSSDYSGTKKIYFEILCKELTINGLRVNDKDYDGTDSATIDSTSIHLDGLLGDDVSTVTLDVDKSVVRFSSSDAGFNIPIIFTVLSLKGDGCGNYVLDYPEEVTSNINKATPVCKNQPVASSISYGDPLSSSKLTGGLFGINGINVTGYYSWNMGDDIRHSVGEHRMDVIFHPGAGFENNFNETTITVDLIVKKRIIDVKWSAGQYVYDGALKTITAVATNVVDNESISFTYSNNEKTDAGSYVASITGFEVENPNYSLGSEPVTHNWKIEKADYCMEGVSFSATEFVYDGKDHSPTIVGLPIGADDIALGVSCSGSVRYVKDSGTTFTVTFSTSSNNYNVPDDMSVNLSVVPRTIDIGWGPTELTYSGSTLVPSAAVKNLVDGDECTITVSGGKIDVGKYEAIVVSVDNENYSHSSESVEFSIIPALLTVRTNDVTVTYGDALSPGGVSISGFVGGQDESCLFGTIEYHHDYSQGSPISDNEHIYVIKASGFTIGNYEFDYIPGTISVVPKEVGLSWQDDSFTYNGENQIPSVTITGLYGDDVCTATVIGGQVDVGEYVAVVTTLSNQNYKLPGVTEHSFTIGKASPIIKTLPVVSNITYGDALSESLITGGSMGFMDQDVTGSFDWSKPSLILRAGTNESVIVFTPGEDHSKNFTGLEFKVLVTVLPRSITVSWSETTSFVYDGSMKFVVASHSNAVGDDVITFTYTGNVGTDAGSYIAEITSISGDDSKCYTLDGSSVTKSWIITKASYDMGGISFDNGAFVYNGSEQAPVIKGSLPIGEDGIQLTVTYSSGATYVSDSGIKVTATFHSESENYVVPKPMVAEVSIIPKTIGLEWSDDVFEYNGELQIPTATATGLIGQDKCNVSVKADGIDAGIHTVMAVSLDNGNYTLPESNSTTYEIHPKFLKVTAKDHTTVYGEAASNEGVTYSGFIEGEDQTVLSGELDYTYDYEAGSPISGEGVGYTITPCGLQSSNYSITYVTGVLTVTQREIGITWSEESFVYNGSEQVPKATATDLFGEDVCSIIVIGGQVDAGDHTATATSLSNPNYRLPSDVDHTFTIGKATVSFVQSAPSIIYSQDMVYVNEVSGLVVTDSHSYSVEDQRFTVSDDGRVTTTMEPNFEDVTVVVTLSISDSKNYVETSLSYTLTVVPDENNIFDVIFKSQDGESTLSTIRVYNGSDAFYIGDAPTKAQDVQYTYTFVGWNTEVGSESATDSILSDVKSDLTVYAAFSKTLRSYTITFVNGDDSSTQTVEYGKVPVYSGSVPTKAPTAQYTFTFSAWGPTLVPVAGDATYTAQYSMTVNKYTVQWKNNGDVIETDLNVPYGTTPSYNGELPLKDSDERFTYTFAGWASPQGDDVGAVRGNVVFEAQYTSLDRLYVVNFISDGITISRTDQKYDTEIVAPSINPTRNPTDQYSYDFIGWAVDGEVQSFDGAKVSGNVTYTSVFDPVLRTYDVIFMNGGTEVKKDTIPYGSAIIKPSDDPSKADEGQLKYKFESWNGYKDGMTVTGNVVFNAIFSTTIKTIVIEEDKSVSIDTNADVVGISEDVFSDSNKSSLESFSVSMSEGTLSMDKKAFGSIDKGVTIQINQIKGVDLTQKQKDAVGDSPVYAIDIIADDENIKTFNGGKITVTLPYSGDGIDGSKITVWCISDGKLEKFKAIYSNGYVTFETPHLSEYSIVVEYTVSFQGLADYKVVSGSEIQIPDYVPEKDPDEEYTYVFSHWKDQNGTILTPGTVIGSDLTFTPVFSYTPRLYDITWKVDDSIYLVQKLTYGSSISVPATPSKVASVQYSYSFKGWTGYSNSDVVNGPKTYNAVFDSILNCYSITWMNGEQVFSYSDDKAYGTEISSPEGVPVKSSDSKYSYTFSGWSGFVTGKTVIGDMVFEASYTQVPMEYDVSFTVVGGPESVAKPSDVKASYGQNVTVSIDSISGYNVSVKVDGTSIQGNTFTMPDRSVQVTIEYTQVQTPGAGSGGSSGGGSSSGGSSGGSGSGGSSGGTPPVTVPPNIGNLPMDGGDAEVSKDVVDAAIKQNKDIGFESDVGKVVLPVDVLKNIGASNGDLVFSMCEADGSKLSEAQMETIGSNTAISIGLSIGSNIIHQLGGKVVVTISFPPVDGKDMSLTVVRYVADDGSTEDMVTFYSDGVISFETDHFSVFMVVLADEQIVQEEHTIKVDISGSGIAYASVQNAVAGTKVTLVYEAEEGYEFSHWISNSVEIVDDSFIMIDEDVMIEAVFTSVPSDDDGGNDQTMYYLLGVIIVIVLVSIVSVMMLRRRT